MRVRLSERQLGLIKEEEKKASVYERFLSHKIIPYIMEKIEQENYDNEDIYGHTVVDLVQEIEDTFGLSYHLASFAVFTWLLRDGSDPEDHWYLADWLYKSPDPMGYLKHSGYYDEYIKDISFNDIDKTEDGKVIFSVDNWEEFADLFDSPDMVRGILGEDYYEMFNYYDYPMTDITESLSDENIKYIIDYIIENYNGQSIGDLSHRNEFEEIINEDGELIVDERLKTILIDGYNLGILIDESDLSNEDIANSLTSAYNSAHNSAAESELWKEAKDEIEGLLESEGKWGKDNMLVFDITNVYQKMIDDYIIESSENPEASYFTSFLYEYLRNYYSGGLLSVRDLNYYYPDSDNVNRDFNDSISSYF
ncbi:hypothetical protein N9994_00375 [bacterium]|nr:hypothetical protein [bacterium]